MIVGPDTPAVITGAAGSLGAETARLLAARGVKVGLLDCDSVRGEALAAEIDGQFVPCDVTSDAEVARGLAACAAEHGPARIALACAAIAPARTFVARDGETGLPLPHETELFVRTVAVNLTGTFRLFALAGAAMATLPPLGSGERGVLVARASPAADDGPAGQCAYAASMAGITGMTLSIARDLASLGIRCCAVLPPRAATRLPAALPGGAGASREAAAPHLAPRGDARDVAALVVHIAENAMLNGTAIRLDGSLHRRFR